MPTMPKSLFAKGLFTIAALTGVIAAMPVSAHSDNRRDGGGWGQDGGWEQRGYRHDYHDGDRADRYDRAAYRHHADRGYGYDRGDRGERGGNAQRGEYQQRGEYADRSDRGDRGDYQQPRYEGFHDQWRP